MTPYLFFNGNCQEALETYARILGAEVRDLMLFKDLPGGDMPEAALGKVMHAKLHLGEKTLMASDDVQGTYKVPQGFSIQLSFPDLAEAQRVYAALAEGGEETMPFGPTFFASGFGTCRDRFGMPWMINCDQQN